MNRAFIFPGQGSQVTGMGQDFFNNFTIAKETFQLINDILGYDLTKIMFEGPADELLQTKNAQPAIMAVSVAITNIIKKSLNLELDSLCKYVAGHSLGEYSALYAAGSINIYDTTSLLKIRGESMQYAASLKGGSMAACIGIPILELEQIIKKAELDGVCSIANDNIEDQIVISGHTDNIQKIIKILKEQSYKAIMLNVSGAFHSNLMKYAENEMQIALSNTIVNKPIVPILQNISAKATQDPIQIKNGLITQICGQVRWRETIDELIALGINEVVEIGYGNILSTMIRKANKGLSVVNIGNTSQLEEFLNSY